MWNDNTKSENACILATLILKDNNIEITKNNINLILNASNVTIEDHWPLFFEKKIKKELLSENKVQQHQKKQSNDDSVKDDTKYKKSSETEKKLDTSEESIDGFGIFN